jgi:hypothetical protein
VLIGGVLGVWEGKGRLCGGTKLIGGPPKGPKLLLLMGRGAEKATSGCSWC